MATEEQINPDVALIKKATAMLGEHFDSVLILATRHESAIEKGTIRFVDRCGNFYASYGHAKMWLLRQEAMEQEEAAEDQRQAQNED